MEGLKGGVLPTHITQFGSAAELVFDICRREDQIKL
jgi:hypothetical protein